MQISFRAMNKAKITKVNEASLNAVLINAVKEQQVKIEAQTEQIKQLKKTRLRDESGSRRLQGEETKMNDRIFKTGKKGKREKRRKGIRAEKILFPKMFLALLSLFLFSFSLAEAQTGGAFTIEKSVIASAGGAVSGGAFTIENTLGQPSAGTSQNSPFVSFGGFITPTLAPTAAAVSISGRVTTASGAGIRNAQVTLNFPNGTTRTAATGAFGAYWFEGVPVGETYIVIVSGKKFSFDNSAQVVHVNEQIADLNFTATEL